MNMAAKRSIMIDFATLEDAKATLIELVDAGTAVGIS